MAPSPATDTSPRARLRRFLSRGLAVQLLCVLIAWLLWQFAHGGSLGINLIYSLAIGNCSWLAIDLGMHLLAMLLGKPARAAYSWPGVPGMLLAVVCGSVFGYFAGTAIGDAFTGLRSPGLFTNRVSGMTTLLAAVAGTYFFYTRERLQIEKTAAEAARRAAAENQLKLLESQLEPHMLFNTLANLRVLIGLDAPRAQAMLDHLIGFLRATLNASRSGAQPLSAEFERLDDYLALMAIRMGPRLAVQFELPAELRDTPVPPLLLQPLVENAIKHGLEPKVAGGRIEVQARREAGRLVLSVRDTGTGLPEGGPGDASDGGTHYGLAHVRERLATLYGERAVLRLQPAPGPEGGTLATVTLPLPDAA